MPKLSPNKWWSQDSQAGDWLRVCALNPCTRHLPPLQWEQDWELLEGRAWGSIAPGNSWGPCGPKTPPTHRRERRAEKLLLHLRLDLCNRRVLVLGTEKGKKALGETAHSLAKRPTCWQRPHGIFFKHTLSKRAKSPQRSLTKIPTPRYFSTWAQAS